MKITDIQTAVVEGNFDWVLVRIYTDEGVTGLGEAYWGAGVNELVHKMRPLLIGENPLNVGKLYEKMIRLGTTFVGEPVSDQTAPARV